MIYVYTSFASLVKSDFPLDCGEKPSLLTHAEGSSVRRIKRFSGKLVSRCRKDVPLQDVRGS
ncbi:MAG: hypothetical protein B6245_15640 [Desulfobacteraceae bacterium 4572_88]|nr:MAG: hypothetical protein B6245_15640 [Desulfobacteraceae bacterium 4572_88]